jgi:hypothetical protein
MKAVEAYEGQIKRLILYSKKPLNKKSLGGVTEADFIKILFY